MLKEWVTMRLKMLPKKGDFHDLSNWRGIMLLDAASKLVSMIFANRLDRVLKEEGLEAQNGFTGGRGVLGRALQPAKGAQAAAGARTRVVGAVR